MIYDLFQASFGNDLFCFGAACVGGTMLACKWLF